MSAWLIRASALFLCLLAAATIRPPAAAHASAEHCNITVRPGQSIEAAVKKANAGQTICVRVGRYVEDPNVFVPAAKRNLTLFGLSTRGALPVVLASGRACTIAVRATGVTISNLALVGGPHGGTDGLCLLAGSAGSKAQNVVARNHRHVGFLVSQTSNIALTKVRAEDNDEIGIHVVSSTAVTIDQAVVSNNGHGAAVDTFWKASGIRFFATSQSTIRNSTVTGNKGAGIYFNGVSNENVIDKNTIQANGDDGINFESNESDKYGDDNPALPAQNVVTSNEIVENHDEGIHIYSGSNNRFESNHITGTGLSGLVFDCQAGAGNVVRSNTIEKSGTDPDHQDHLYQNGVVLANPEPVQLSDNTIQDNPGDGIHVERVTCEEVGKAPKYSTGATAHVIQSNTIKGNGKSGVHVMGVREVQVLQNAIQSNHEDGVLLNQGDATAPAKGCVIRNNQIHDNGRDGIRLDESSDENTIEGNQVLSNGARGLDLNPSSSDTVNGNTFNSNAGSGIGLEDGSGGSSFTFNHVEGNGVGISVAAGAAGNTIVQNSFIGNGTNGWSGNPSGTNTWMTGGVCPEGNYWSDYATWPHPLCPAIWLGAKVLPDERDHAPLINPPA